MPTNEQIEEIAKRLGGDCDPMDETEIWEMRIEAAAMLRQWIAEREVAGKIAKAETIVAKIRLERVGK